MSDDERTVDDSLWGYVSQPESRWPASAAIVAVILLQLFLPDTLTFGPEWVFPGIELAVLVTLTVVGPSKLDEEAKDIRWVSLTLIAILSAADALTLGLLISHLVKQGDVTQGRTLIFSAVGVWFTAVVAFGLWFWEIDRGGPIARCSAHHRPPDFLFPQMENPGVSRTRWTPMFWDYLYLSLTNSTAFSPTDTLPLTRRAKLLMAIQSLVSLATIVVVGARAVNILK
jgi:uncharacterized membrane protein